MLTGQRERAKDEKIKIYGISATENAVVGQKFERDLLLYFISRLTEIVAVFTVIRIVLNGIVIKTTCDMYNVCTLRKNHRNK